jgi:hypothetical protein
VRLVIKIDCIKEVEGRNPEFVQAILGTAEADDLNVLLLNKGMGGDTALNKALSDGDKEIIIAIFKKLFVASNLPILKEALLVNNDYDVSPLHSLVLVSDKILQEVLVLARGNNALEALLMPKAGESTALHFAVYEEKIGIIAKILEESGKVAGLQKSVLLAKNSDSVTPLYIAIETDKVEVVEAAMASTDVDVLKEMFSYKSRTGDTVLHAANNRDVKEVKKAMYEKVLSHKDLLGTLTILDGYDVSPLRNLAVTEEGLVEEILQTAKTNNLLKDLLALARDEAAAAKDVAEKAELDGVVSIIEIEMGISPRTEEEKVLPDAKVITRIETMDIVHDTQLAAIESFANAKPVFDNTKLLADRGLANQAHADAILAQTSFMPAGKKAKQNHVAAKAAEKQGLDQTVATTKEALDTVDAKLNSIAHRAAVAPFYMKTGLALSQGADLIETADYVSKKLGYEPSNSASNAIYYGHELLKLSSAVSLVLGGGGQVLPSLGVVVSSVGQTHTVNDFISNYASNSVLVNGVTIVVSTTVAGLIGGVPLAIVSVASPIANFGLNKAIEYGLISSDDTVVAVAQPILTILTLAPQIMGAYYNPYAVGKVVASINIIKTADELGTFGLIYDQLPTREVAKEFVLSHPFADAAVVTEAFSVLTFSLGKTVALTSFGVAAPWFFGIGAAFAAT